MTPEQQAAEVLKKHSVISMGPTSDLIAAMLEFSLLRLREEAGKAWKTAESCYDLDKGRSPGIDDSLASLTLTVEDKWISVEEAMPAINVEPGVLGYSVRGGIDKVSVYNDGNWNPIFQKGWNKGETYEITHWQPLPLPPQPGK